MQYREPCGPADASDRDGGIELSRRRAREAGAVFEVFDKRPFQAPAFWAMLRRFRPEAVIGQTSSFYFDLLSRGWPVGRGIGFASWMRDTHDPPFISGCNDDRTPAVAYALRLLDSEVRAFERGRPAFSVKQLIPMSWLEGDTLPTFRRRSVRRRRRTPCSADAAGCSLPFPIPGKKTPEFFQDP